MNSKGKIRSICPVCMKVFYVPPCRIKSGAKYCSKGCSEEGWYRINQQAIMKELKNCDKLIINGKEVYTNKDGKSFILRKIKAYGRVKLKKEYGEVNKCKGCNKDFFSIARYIRSNKYGGKYCGQKCFSKYGFSRDKHWHWKGGKSTSTGYIKVHNRQHPSANDFGYTYEHRYVIEKHIGRKLERNEVIHHIDGTRTNNELENLILLTDSQHKSFHGRFSEFAYEFVTSKAPHLQKDYFDFMHKKSKEITEQEK